MAVKVLKLLLIEVIMCKVKSSYLQQTQQYFQVAGQPYYQLPSTSSSHSPSHSYAPPIPTAYQSTVTSPYVDYSLYQTVTPQVTASIKNSVAAPVQPPKISYSSVTETKPKSSPTLTPPPLAGFDSNVLNNLAIALQLLIVSNLLNTPMSEPIPHVHNPSLQPKRSEYESVPTANPYSAYYASTPNSNSNPGSNEPSALQSYSTNSQPNEYQAYFETNPYDQTLNSQYSLPNANYLGSSNNFGGLFNSFGVPPASTRPGLNLKSPYDVLASPPSSENTPLSSFEYTKNDFQSPYAAILAADSNKDLFSIDF